MPGEAEIRVKLTVGSNTASVQAKRTVYFIDPILLDLPLYIGSKPCPLCATLLIPPNHGAYLEFLLKKGEKFEKNIDVRSLCNDSLEGQTVSWLQEKRMFTSRSKLGKANFEITDSKNSVNSRTLTVEVAN